MQNQSLLIIQKKKFTGEKITQVYWENEENKVICDFSGIGVKEEGLVISNRKELTKYHIKPPNKKTLL